MHRPPGRSHPASDPAIIADNYANAEKAILGHTLVNKFLAAGRMSLISYSVVYRSQPDFLWWLWLCAFANFLGFVWVGCSITNCPSPRVPSAPQSRYMDRARHPDQLGNTATGLERPERREIAIKTMNSDKEVSNNF